MTIATETRRSDRSAAFGWPTIVVSAAGVAAGVIHLAMVPSHAAESTLEAVGFAAFGWVQIVGAIWMLLRRSAPVSAVVALANLTAVALWVWSRTSGLPFGGHAGEAASVTSVDLTAAALGALAALGAAVLFVFPHVGERSSVGALTLASGLGTAGLVAASLVLASPAARDHEASHAHEPSPGAPLALAGTDDHPHDDTELVVGAAAAVPEVATDPHGHTTPASSAATVAIEDRCDLGFNPAAYWEETALAGIDTVTGSHALAAGHDHAAVTATIEGSAELDRLIAITTQPDGAESKDAKVVAELGTVSDETYRDWLRWLPTYTAAHSTGVSVDDNGGHGGHLGPQTWVAMTDQTQCDTLAAELAQAKEVASQFPTAADAQARGWFKVTNYVPGIAAHYMNFRLVDGEFDIAEPEMLLYDGNGPEASIVGLSYYLIHNSDYEPTQGFTGPNDHFHRHIGLCVGVGGVIGDSSTSEEDCAARGGRKQASTGGWMNHVWIVPGCESPWGMFSGASPVLERSLAAASGTDGGGCAGSTVRGRYDLGPATPADVQALQNG